MDTRIIPGKLVAPERSAHYLPRPRLDGLWDDWRRRRLVLVTAGAGSGKTSFLAANAAASTRPVRWLTLDEFDRDPVTFRAHLLALLGVGGLAGGNATEDLAALVRAQAGGAAGAVVVLDDAQHLAAAPEPLELLARWVRYQPAGCTLVLSSREPLGLPAAKLRAGGEAAVLSAADLALREDEVRDLFAVHHPGAELPAALSRRVVEVTEGWAAGVQILFQAAAGAGPEAVAQAMDDVSGARVGWFAYLVEEVIDRLDPGLRRFLLETCHLPRLDGALCDEVLGATGSARILDDLVRRNLFTTVDDQGGTRTHLLLRDVLRERRARELPAARIKRLQKNAARALLRRGAWAEALGAHAAAGEQAAVLALAARHGDELLASGRHATIREAFATVPARDLRDHAGASLVFGRALEALGDWTRAEAVYRASLRRAATGGRRVELMSLVAQIQMRQARYEGCLRLCRAALRERARPDQATRGRLLNMIGVSLCEMGRLDEGERQLDEARALLRRCGTEEDETRAFYLLQSNIHYRRGEFQAAKDAARRALAVFRRRRDQRRVCHSLGVLAHVSAEAGDVAEARDLALEGLRLADSLDYPLMGGYCRLALGRAALVAGDPQRAEEHFRAARDRGGQVGETGLLVLPLLGLAEAARASGRRHAATTLAREALAASRGRKIVYQEAQALSLLGDLEWSRSAAAARRAWRASEAVMRRVGMRFDLHRLLLQRLDAGDAAGRAHDQLLEELLEGVAASGHEFLLRRLEKERALRVLASALGVPACAEAAAGHLAVMGEAAVPLLAAALDDPARAPAAAAVLARLDVKPARAILTAAAARGSAAAAERLSAGPPAGPGPETPLAIRALGPLEVRAGGRTLTLADWTSRRALRLFQLLLLRRFRWVPRDEAIELLWPETEPERGANNLRQTLHVLRKVLEPGAVATRQFRYVLSHGEAVRLDPGEGYQYDVEACDERLRAAEAAWHGGRPQDAEAAALAGLRLYRGPVLAECPYEELATEEREGLRDRLLHGVGRLGDRYAGARRWEELAGLARTAIALDPFHEEFHRRLVEALAGLGHRTEALEAYHRYETMMTRELDLLPSPAMIDLAERVAAGAGIGKGGAR